MKATAIVRARRTSRPEAGGLRSMRIVVFCPNLIGDTVMATPTLRALRQAFADATIDAVIKPGVFPTLDGCPWLDHRILFDPRAEQARHRTPALLAYLRSNHYDLAVLLPNSFRSALLAWLGRCRRRVGYARGGRGWLLTDRLAPPRDPRGRYVPVPAVDYYLKLARHLGCRIDSTRLELFTTDADEQAADRVWDALGLPADGPVVCLNTGGAFGPAKSWPVEHFAGLARKLAAEAAVDCLVLCGPQEREAARAIVARANHPRVVSLAQQTLGIGLSKACVRRSALLITTDSGPRHFAAAFGVPVVSLFGPTHIAWTRTYHPHALHLQQPVPCGPCQKGVCREGHHRCMVELDPDRVYAAALRLLGRRVHAG
jgi:heptosyltransferase-2